MKGEGPAWGVVDVEWDAAACAYRVMNRSAHSVRVRLTGSAGNVELKLEPGTDTLVELPHFDLPYHAAFCL